MYNKSCLTVKLIKNQLVLPTVENKTFVMFTTTTILTMTKLHWKRRLEKKKIFIKNHVL